MEESIINKKKKKITILTISGLFAIVFVLIGVTYAFFNYTRTGSANTIRVGRIAFNTTQASGQNGAISLTNVFPIARSSAAEDTDNSGEVVVTITGDTDYSGGVEYLVTATGVENTVGGKNVPISVIVTPSAGLGTESATYYTARNSTTSHIYKVEAGNTIENNGKILVGYIAPNSTLGTANGINGTLTIKAFIDSSLVGISDTYNNGNTPTDEMGTPASFGENRTILTTTEWNSLQSSGIRFKIKVEANEGKWVKQIPTISLSPASGGVASGSSTTSTISTTGDGTMTCSSSNQSIATCSVSGSTLTINGVAVGNATITVNQAEGTNYTAGNATYLATVEAPAYPTISSCPGCKFMYTTNQYQYGGANNASATTVADIPTGVVKEDYTEVISTSGKNYFLGFTESNGKIDRAFACGIKGETPNNGVAFCVEGALSDSKGGNSETRAAVYNANSTLLNDSITGLWQGGCAAVGSDVNCDGSVDAGAYSDGLAGVEGDDGGCTVGSDGVAYCGGW